MYASSDTAADRCCSNSALLNGGVSVEAIKRRNEQKVTTCAAVSAQLITCELVHCRLPTSDVFRRSLYPAHFSEHEKIVKL